MSNAALERLIAIARRDTGQSRKVATSLPAPLKGTTGLAWWNAEECGGFDLTEVWGVDAAIARDMAEVFGLIGGWREYSDTLGYAKQFESIARLWRSV